MAFAGVACPVAAALILAAAATGTPLAPARAQTTSPPPAEAAGTPRAPTQAALRLADEYMRASGMEEFGTLVHAVTRRRLGEVVREKRPDLAARPDSLDRVLDAHFTWPALREHAVGHLAMGQAEADLRKGVELYRSPLGRRLAAANARLAQQVAASAAPVDSFEQRLGAAYAAEAAAVGALESFLNGPDAQLASALLLLQHDVWLRAVMSLRADVERRAPGFTALRPGRQAGSYEFDVDEPAVQLPVGAPTYPESLRSAGVQGTVVAEFVVNRDGRADSTSLRVLQSTHEQLTAAVRAALPHMRFTPARLLGLRTRQLVQLPFEFGVRR